VADVTRLRSDARRNRDAIIAAARTVFDSGEQIRFDDFASRAGVGVGTLYRHFPTRAALAAAVYGAEVSALCASARTGTGRSGERLDAFLFAFADYLVEHAALARSLTSIVAVDVQAEGSRDLEHTLTDLMREAAADGDIRGDVTPAAVLIVLHGIASAISGPQAGSDARTVARILVAGLRR